MIDWLPEESYKILQRNSRDILHNLLQSTTLGEHPAGLVPLLNSCCMEALIHRDSCPLCKFLRGINFLLLTHPSPKATEPQLHLRNCLSSTHSQDCRVLDPLAWQKGQDLELGFYF